MIDASDVHVVDDTSVDFDLKLRQAIEPAFRCPPVEAVAPVVDDVSQDPARHAVFPAAFADLIRPSGHFKPTSEIGNAVLIGL